MGQEEQEQEHLFGDRSPAVSEVGDRAEGDAEVVGRGGGEQAGRSAKTPRVSGGRAQMDRHGPGEDDVEGAEGESGISYPGS